MADFTFAHREEGFDKHIEQSIRGYSDLIQDVISLSRHFIEDNTNVVDIGCSTGKMTKALIDYNLDHCNNTKYIGLEIAQGFQGDLQKRKEEINKYYRNVRFEDSDARWYEYEDCSLITSISVLVKQSNACNQPTMVIEQTGGGGNPSDTQGLHIKMAGQNQGSGRSLRVTTENSSLNSGTAYDPLLVENGGTTRFASPNGTGNINFYNNNLYLQSNSGEVYATDSGGKHTQLSPHNFQYIPGGASETGAWAYLSEKVEPRKEIITKTIDGKEITEETGEMLVTREKDDKFTYVNVDMMKVVREVEKLTGTKLIYTGTNGEDDGSTVKEDIIAGLVKRIETLEAKVKALEEA